MIRDMKAVTWSSGFMLVALIVVFILSFVLMIPAARAGDVLQLIGWIVVMTAAMISFAGLFVVNPNEGRVLQLFGSYVGTVRQPGLRFANPFYTKKHISLRVRNFESARLKVNDIEGNPIEIAAVVVWRVVDT